MESIEHYEVWDARWICSNGFHEEWTCLEKFEEGKFTFGGWMDEEGYLRQENDFGFVGDKYITDSLLDHGIRVEDDIPDNSPKLEAVSSKMVFRRGKFYAFKYKPEENEGHFLEVEGDDLITYRFPIEKEELRYIYNWADQDENGYSGLARFSFVKISWLTDIMEKAGENLAFLSFMKANPPVCPDVYLADLHSNGLYISSVMPLDCFLAGLRRALHSRREKEAADDIWRLSKGLQREEVERRAEGSEWHSIWYNNYEKFHKLKEEYNKLVKAGELYQSLPVPPITHNPNASWYNGTGEPRFFATYFRFIERDGYWYIVDPAGKEFTLMGDLFVEAEYANIDRISEDSFKDCCVILPDGALMQGYGLHGSVIMPVDYIAGLAKTLPEGIGSLKNYLEENQKTALFDFLESPPRGMTGLKDVSFLDARKRCFLCKYEQDRPYMYWKGVLARDSIRDNEDISYFFKPEINQYIFKYAEKFWGEQR